MANYFNTLSLGQKLEQLSKCRFMETSEFQGGVNALKDKKIVKKVDVECQKIIKKINSKTIEIQSIVDKKL